MIWILGAVLLGLMIGYISYAFQKAFLGAMVLSLPIVGLIYFRVLLPLARVSGLGQGDPITVILEMMSLLPQDIQSAITIFPMAAFGGRLIVWAYAKFISKPAVEETRSDRKKRILEQYGYKDGFPN